jgi:hypothetical protein
MARRVGGTNQFEEAAVGRTQLKAAAANYTYLRGLFFLPLGLLPIVSALGNTEWGLLRYPWVFLAVVGLLGIACVPINNFYNKYYGRLRPSPGQQARAGVAVVLAIVVVAAGSTLLRSNASWSLDLPVNATAVTLSAAVILSYAAGRVLNVHHLIIWVTVLVSGAIPLWNGPDPSNIGLAIVGVALMVTGVFDHLLFVRTFGAPAAIDVRDDNERA